MGRLIADVGLVVAFVFNVPLVIREGTIIGVIMFGPLIGVFMKLLKPVFKKLDLLEHK